MKGTVLYSPRDIRFEDRETPKIVESTDAVIRITATCVCGSDLWPYRGLQADQRANADGPRILRHRRGSRQRGQSIKPGQFVVGSFAPPIIPVLIASTAIVLLGSSRFICGRRRRCCGCRWRAGRWCRLRGSVGGFSAEPADGARMCWARAGSPPMRPTYTGWRPSLSSATARSAPRRTFGQADGGRADHRDEPS